MWLVKENSNQGVLFLVEHPPRRKFVTYLVFMPRKRIDRFINEALENFSHWLKSNQWRGKEHDCVNLFAHKFLFEKIEPGAAIQCPTQI
jgi:hypothetical protein